MGSTTSRGHAGRLASGTRARLALVGLLTGLLLAGAPDLAGAATEGSDPGTTDPGTTDPGSTDPGTTGPGSGVPEGFQSGLPECCGDPAPHPASPETPYYTFVSMPDFLNADVGDLARLEGWFAQFWDGLVNSWSDTYAGALDVVLGQVRAEEPDDVLVAGDLVEGHWGVDVDETSLFGPVGTLKQKRRAVSRAGAFYYGEWLEMFSSRGLPRPHVAVGDHEVGDNPWHRGGFKHRSVRRFKHVFATNMIDGRYPRSRRPRGTPYERTSYWTPLDDKVMLVSVDVMRRFPGNVHPRHGGLTAALDGEHLRWFRRTLARGRRDFEWVVVQAHTPILGPVRHRGSSNLRLAGGPRSAMWRAMVRHEVDLYLTGEVHDVTAIDPRGRKPVQISHGGHFTMGASRYLRADFFPDRVELSSYGFVSRVDRRSPRLWQTSAKRVARTDLTYRPGAVLRGTAVLTRDGELRQRTGDLAPAQDLGRER